MYIPKILGLGLALAIAALPQDKPQLRARELFYTPIADTAPAAKAKPTTPAKTATVKTAKPPKPKPGRISDPTPDTPDETSEAHLQNVSHTAAVVGPPLALKYRLLKRADDGQYNEVDSDTVFRSGDKIRVSVEANDGAYLYIVQQGSSKAWNVLFPNEDTEHGNNHIQRNREYELPGGGRFTFDEQPGTERLFLVLSRRPEPDLEKLIYSLHGGTGKPASDPKTDSKAETRMMIAQSRIDDAIVNRLRTQFLSRDLVFEKVDDETPQRSGGSRRETALYVATTDRTANARVVVDLTLKHQ